MPTLAIKNAIKLGIVTDNSYGNIIESLLPDG